ncbi:MAG: phosphotransferase family protein [Burkholderiaceae bacterium]|nr:phosphotransferase family protein [Burkholderiaceae bacterium]
MSAELSAGLAAALSPVLGPGTAVQGLRRLSGGASQETWAFDAVSAAGHRALILRRAPPGAAERGSGNAGLAAEAELIGLAGAAGAPVPEVLRVLQPADGLGSGFVMQRLPGETLGRRIAAAQRPQLARQCGEALARIHAVPVDALPPLRTSQPRAEVEHLRQWHARHGAARPVFQLALRWLADHAPADGPLALVHGDFRNGNLMVDLAAPGGAPGGTLVGVLDWELACLGDPCADLGWICVNAWRYGQWQRTVGGFGTLDDLLEGYTAAGGRADRERIHWWQVLGTLRWGVICESMGEAWRSGAEPVIEKAAIGRRASEAEIDLLELLLPRPETA